MKKPLPPGPKPTEFFRIWNGLKNEPLRLLQDLNEKFGHILFFHFANRSFTFLSHPEQIRHVLKDNQRNYTKSINYQKLKILMGNGLVTSEGSFWLRQRRMIQPIFHQKQIERFLEVMRTCTYELIGRWRLLKKDAEIDVAEEISFLTLHIVGQTLLGVDVSHAATQVRESLTVALHYTNNQINSLIQIPLCLPTPQNLRVRKAIRFLDAIIYDIIEKNRRSPTANFNLVSLLLNARDDETGATMDAKQIRDEAMTIFLAGHETTATALSFALLLLAENPQYVAKIREESAAGDLNQMVVTQMFLEETMRLYPPAWMFERNPISEDALGGYRIPANTMVFISPFITHRHPDFWSDPKEFKPERFHPDAKDKIIPFSYFPFGGGPRQCIGQQFALLEAKVVLGLLCQHFNFEKVADHPIRLEAKVTLRAKHGIRLKLTKV